MMTRIGCIVIALAVAAGCDKDKPADYGSPTPSKSKPGKEPAPSGGPVAPEQAEEGPAPTQVRIEVHPARVGSVATSETSSNTQLQFSGNGRDAMIDATQSELRHIEVVEADGPAIKKAKVHYERQTRAERKGAIEQEFGEPLDGKKFVVWSAGGKLAATTDSGGEVPADQLEGLLGDLDDELGVVPGIDRVLFGRSWTYGVPVTLSPDDLAAISGDMPEGTRATAGTATAITQKQGVATFQLDLTIEVGEIGKNGFAVKSVATYQADIAEGRRISRQASSTLDGVLDGMVGKGTLTETEALRYR
jgi:hypothetical protein